MIVLVLYHGAEEWTAPEELEELFALDGVAPAAREALRPYLPKQRYLLEVVPEDPADGAVGPGHRTHDPGGAEARDGPRRSRRSSSSLTPDLQVEKAKGEPGLHHIGVLVEYLMVVNPEATQEKLEEALKPMGTEVQELPKTYGLRIIEQGRQEGRDEGRRERDLELARKALAKGMSPAEVAELTDLPFEEVQKLAH